MDINNSINEINILNQKFCNKYQCIQKLGEGSFGSIYKAEYNGNYYALKFEKNKKDQNLLENEGAIMNYLKGPNIPYIYGYSSTSNFNILIMQLLGKNLETIFEEKKNFSLKTVCMIGYQFISILEYIHNRHIIHRDIKPDNFVMGLNDLSQYIYIIDFGLAKKYRSSTTLKQLPFVHRGKIIGTARYASINAMKGYELSRRDDLESAGYVLLYFIKGRLPWQGIITKTKEERYKKILAKKMEISSEELCDGLPEEFEKFIKYVKNLEYLQQPDYEMLRGFFNLMLRKEHYKFDYIYDWTTYEEMLKRRVITPRSEIDSTQNKKTNFASFIHQGDSREENDNGINNKLVFKNNNNDDNNNINNNKINEPNNINIINNKVYKENDNENTFLNINNNNLINNKSEFVTKEDMEKAFNEQKKYYENKMISMQNEINDLKNKINNLTELVENIGKCFTKSINKESKNNQDKNNI